MRVIITHRETLCHNMLQSISEIDAYAVTLKSAFTSLKAEYSPLMKLEYLLKVTLLVLLINSRFHQSNNSSGKDL